MNEDQESAIFQKLKVVLTVKADERLIFKFDEQLSAKLADRITQQIRAALGDDLRFLVIGEGIDVDIIKQEETA